jgi:hypothetical protein
MDLLRTNGRRRAVEDALRCPDAERADEDLMRKAIAATAPTAIATAVAAPAAAPEAAMTLDDESLSLLNGSDDNGSGRRPTGSNRNLGGSNDDQPPSPPSGRLPLRERTLPKKGSHSRREQARTWSAGDRGKQLDNNGLGGRRRRSLGCDTPRRGALHDADVTSAFDATGEPPNIFGIAAAADEEEKDYELQTLHGEWGGGSANKPSPERHESPECVCWFAEAIEEERAGSVAHLPPTPPLLYLRGGRPSEQTNAPPPPLIVEPRRALLFSPRSVPSPSHEERQRAVARARRRHLTQSAAATDTPAAALQSVPTKPPAPNIDEPITAGAFTRDQHEHPRRERCGVCLNGACYC